jgi:hypothetical protein
MVSRVPLSGLGGGTSDEGDGALDDALGFFVEIETIGADAGVHGGFVEETFHHFEEHVAL